MSEIQIPLNFNRPDFEEIYFKNNQGSIFFSRQMKPIFLFFLFSVIAFISIIVYDIYASTFLNISLALFFVCIFTAFLYIRAAAAILKWKNGIHAYLDSIEHYHCFKLILTDTTISVQMDDEERIEKWSAINNAIINDEFISLASTLNHFYPRKSMSGQDYEILRVFVLNKIKN